jgi:hypothetical protein
MQAWRGDPHRAVWANRRVESLAGFPEELEKFRALGHLPFTTQLLVTALNKRTIDESIVHQSRETPKPRLNPLILSSQ